VLALRAELERERVARAGAERRLEAGAGLVAGAKAEADAARAQSGALLELVEHQRGQYEAMLGEARRRAEEQVRLRAEADDRSVEAERMLREAGRKAGEGKEAGMVPLARLQAAEEEWDKQRAALERRERELLARAVLAEARAEGLEEQRVRSDMLIEKLQGRIGYVEGSLRAHQVSRYTKSLNHGSLEYQTNTEKSVDEVTYDDVDDDGIDVDAMTADAVATLANAIQKQLSLRQFDGSEFIESRPGLEFANRILKNITINKDSPI
jgi:hypothetical protein